MADRREAMPTQRPGAKRRAEGDVKKFYCGVLAEQWNFFTSLSERHSQSQRKEVPKSNARQMSRRVI